MTDKKIVELLRYGRNNGKLPPTMTMDELTELSDKGFYDWQEQFITDSGLNLLDEADERLKHTRLTYAAVILSALTLLFTLLPHFLKVSV